MKKIYMEPSVKVVNLGMQTLLAGSLTGGDNNLNTNPDNQIDDPNEIGAKEAGWFDED